LVPRVLPVLQVLRGKKAIKVTMVTSVLVAPVVILVKEAIGACLGLRDLLDKLVHEVIRGLRVLKVGLLVLKAYKAHQDREVEMANQDL
jgi:hypothetical protein